MTLRTFYFVLLSVLATVIALSSAWEFWAEDVLLSRLMGEHDPEPTAERFEFVVTTAVFSFIALLAPAAVGTRLIRQDQALRQEVVRLSREDDLTGLSNRRRITELLASEIGRADRYGTAFCVILADVDYFKSVNDRLGHQAGDAVLTGIARVIRSSVRSTDPVGRWGGEEFIVVSPQTDLTGGLALAEKIRMRIESSGLCPAGPITASFGVTVFARGDDMESIISRADAGLYAAKQGGRNRVEEMQADAGVVDSTGSSDDRSSRMDEAGEPRFSSRTSRSS